MVDAVPGPGRSARVRQRREMPGGKGANQAVGLAAAASATVGHPGGRPALTPKAIQDQLALVTGL